jgi:hypothetical protein
MDVYNYDSIIERQPEGRKKPQIEKPLHLITVMNCDPVKAVLCEP